jgi:hypothetical protein
MAKRQIVIDGEVKLVSHSEWLKHQTEPKKSQSKKPKIKDIQVESDPIQVESIEQDQHNSEE